MSSMVGLGIFPPATHPLSPSAKPTNTHHMNTTQQLTASGGLICYEQTGIGLVVSASEHNMVCAQLTARAEAAESLAAEKDKALTEIVKAATRVSNLGAVTGSQWLTLSGAIVTARATLALTPADMGSKLAELESTFSMRWDADQRAIKRWQSAHPDKPLTWPDHADLIIWLEARIAEQDAELQRLRELTDKLDRDAITNGGHAADQIERITQLEAHRDALIAAGNAMAILLLNTSDLPHEIAAWDAAERASQPTT